MSEWAKEFCEARPWLKADPSWLDFICSRLDEDPVLSFELFCGLIEKESQWDPLARGRADDLGLCQMIPKSIEDLCSRTKFRLTHEELTDPFVAIEAAIQFLKLIRSDLHKYNLDADWHLLSAYNLGVKAYVVDGKINPSYPGDVFCNAQKY